MLFSIGIEYTTDFSDSVHRLYGTSWFWGLDDPQSDRSRLFLPLHWNEKKEGKSHF
jgi:hypothetical protein